ncbi:MAG: recombination mediator protein UvsY [Candidatus Poseidoniales archaeon]
MMNIDEIVQSWREDSKIDDLNLDKENVRIPSLHSKYVGMMVDENKSLRTLYRDRAILRRLLRSYYLGKADTDDLEKLGRDQFLEKILKNELNDYMDTDELMIRVNAKISSQEEKIDVLKEIIRSINSRGYQLKNAIDWHRLTLG